MLSILKKTFKTIRNRGLHYIRKETSKITRAADFELLLFVDMDDQHPLTQAAIRGRRKEVPDLDKQCLDAGEGTKSIVEKFVLQ